MFMRPFGSIGIHRGWYGSSEAGASDAASRAQRLETELTYLNARVERILMLSEALWTLMKERQGHTDEELVDRIEAIDLADGVRDGKVAPSPPLECPTCKRKLGRRNLICLYCGQPIEVEPFQR